MARAIKWFYIFLYVFIACALLAIAMGYEEKLFAEGQVIKTFRAGPEKVPHKQEQGVKTNFNWSRPSPCNCPDSQGPCIQTFLDKPAIQSQQRYPSMIEDYYIQTNMGSLYQGAGQVPWGIDVSSVRLINIPFCGQVKNKKPSTK